ncbi:hypothetical protein AAFF_G00362140 [Aldrovandia affinis]|uniref:Aldehyde dehydrogenase family 3 member A2 n=1 Tax=Aldrovandia affinis TaxID=143900 RepID=A0AAD7WN78_9TELE|nr:hypothetical protein AAFF_G00362140 [Aldrovandia affinis]
MSVWSDWEGPCLILAQLSDVVYRAWLHLRPRVVMLHRDQLAQIGGSCRRITWGKFENCGQTCIAPDYILCEPDIQDRVVEEIRKSVQEFYTDDPKTFSDYGRIINVSHFRRVMGLMAGCTVAFGGASDES